MAIDVHGRCLVTVAISIRHVLRKCRIDEHDQEPIRSCSSRHLSASLLASHGGTAMAGEGDAEAEPEDKAGKDSIR